MPPRKAPNHHDSGSQQNESDASETPTATQFQELMQAMIAQQRQANENQARFQEQLARKDDEMAQVQRQLLEVLQNRNVAPPVGLQIVIQNRDPDPNALFENFRKRAPKEFSGNEDPLVAED